MADVLKLRHTVSTAGGEATFWDDHWSELAFDAALRRAAVDPVQPLFEANVRPGATLLEAGCGMGEHVVHQRGRGVFAVGLDFAERTLFALRQHEPTLPLVVGDVNHLPFRVGAFDACYSGGVVEHIEEGPGASLLEVARVLKPGGVVLVSVPLLNPLRRLVRPLHRGRWADVDGPAVGDHDGVFWQYVFAPRRFVDELRNAGLVARAQVPYGVIRGMWDLPLPIGAAVRARARWSRARLSRTTNVAQESGATSPPPLSRPRALAKRTEAVIRRVLVSEDVSTPLAGPVVRAVRPLVANMVMFVCDRPASGELAQQHDVRLADQRQRFDDP